MADWLEVSSNEAARLIHDLMMDPPAIVSTGLATVDRAQMTWGCQKGIPRGTYVIVGGASNVGKTQFGLHLARMAANAGEKAGVVSLDMKERDAMLRIHQALCQHGGIPKDAWRPDRWKPEYEQELRESLRRWRLSINGSLALNAIAVGDLGMVVTALQEGIDAGGTFFVVDHMQKIRVSGTSDGQIAARAEIVSETLDNLADRNDVTIVGLSQLNREAAKQRDRTPTMADLWGGTAMESNSSLVLLLDHSRYDRDPMKAHLGRTWVLLDKNTNGPKGFEVPVEVNHRTLGFREAEPDELGQWPGTDEQKRRRRVA